MLKIHNAGLETQPAVHAFIVGISDYTHLPDIGQPTNANQLNLSKLSSPAASAFAFYQWLTAAATQLARPLATTHLLLAPSPVEIAKQPAMAPFASNATFREFRGAAAEWRSFCSGHKEKQAIFFFSGHGVQSRENDALVLLQDWGAPNSTFDDAMISIESFIFAMVPHKISTVADSDFTNIALDQIYFVDACRDRPEQVDELQSLKGAKVLNVGLPDADLRSRPTFFSTVPGQQAFGVPGEVSLFTAALLEALALACEGEEPDAAGRATWPVKARFFSDVLKFRTRQQAGKHGVSILDRAGNVQGVLGETVLHLLPQRPEFEGSIQIMPEGAVKAAEIEIVSLDDDRTHWRTPQQGEPRPQYPFAVQVKLGAYRVIGQFDQETVRKTWTTKASEAGSRCMIFFPPPAGDA